MKRQFIPDKEISLSKENDYLKTGVYADNLTKIIRNTPLNEVFTVGLFGNWGTGKSSIIETSKNTIEDDNSKIKFITYDAWKYANDSFRRMFLLKVHEELRQEQTDDMKRFYMSENAEAKPKQVFTIKGLPILLMALMLFIIIINFLDIGDVKKVTFASLVALGGLLITVINGFFHSLKISINKPALFAPEQFENCFKQMMEISLKKENYIIRNFKKIVEYVKRGETTITNLEKIVIVIDNIDRCHSAMAYQLLTDVKTFLSNERYNIVFVIPVDDEALKKHLFSNTLHSADQCNIEKEEFLRKFFNVTLRIKPHQKLEMETFARKINVNHKLGFNNDTLSLVAKEFATNPRRIIQLFNNLSTELSLYPEGFATKNESIICAIIVLREEYHNFYKDSVNNVNLLFGAYIKDKKYIDNESQEPKDEFKETFTFMRMAGAYFKSSNHSDILQILTNTGAQFSFIPFDIQDAIITADIQKTISFTEENGELKVDILQFIQNKISEDSKYGSELQMLTWLNFVSLFQDKISIERSDLVKLDNDMSQYYETIIPKSTDIDSICKYAKHLYYNDLSYLKEVIFKYIVSDFEKVPNNFTNYTKSVLKYFNDEKYSQELTAFADKHFSSSYIETDIEYTIAQKKFLFSDTLVQENIKNITELIKDDKVEKLLWLFENKPNISNETYGAFFSHVSNTIGEIRNNTKEEVLHIIMFSMPFVNTIAPRKLQKEPAELYNKLFAERLRNKAGYESYDPIQYLPANYPHVYEKCMLINECLNNEEESKLLIDFICKIYDITGNSTKTKPQFEILMETYRTDINSKLVELLTKGFTLVPLFDIIISDVNYSSDDSMKLITNCFTQKDENGKLYLSQEQIVSKITSLLDNVDIPNVTPLITKLIDNDTIKTAVANDIINRNDTGFTNSLPTQLLSLAINVFSEADSSSYATNFAYLRIIAEKGSVSQKSVIIRILIKHIEDNNHIEDVLSIIEIINITKKTDKDLIVANLNSYKEKYNNINVEVMSKIDQTIMKLSPKERIT